MVLKESSQSLLTVCIAYSSEGPIISMEGFDWPKVQKPEGSAVEGLAGKWPRKDSPSRF